MNITFTLNGDEQSFEVEPGTLLIELLRDEGIWSVKRGDETGAAGADTVLLDGEPVSSEILLAAQVDGRNVTTVEDLGSIYNLHPIQQAYLDQGAVQCGYCTPGMILTTKSLLDETDNEPTRDQIEVALDGNMCRCTGYKRPVEAVETAAEQLEGD